MAMQSIGNFGGIAPQPAATQGDAPQVAMPTRAAAPVEVSAPASPPPQQPSREEVQQAVEAVRKSISQSASNNLQFSVDSETQQTIVRVTDIQTGELIRQIPSEEMVELAKALDRMQQGILLRQQA
jgi:flagellar protein FlaG